MDRLGPNTNAPLSVLSPTVLLCAGEDPEEFHGALEEFAAGPVQEFFHYRCYRFWKVGAATAIWTGIGTGCLEPLLAEILVPRVIRRIALVGTAGSLRKSFDGTATCCLIDRATSLGTALDAWAESESFAPRLRTVDAASAPCASMLSTDFYYLASPARLAEAGGFLSPAFGERFEERLRDTDWIDMETAQFYFLASLFGGASLTDYFAVKGASNSVFDQSEQVSRSESILVQAVRLAGRLLGS